MHSPRPTASPSRNSTTTSSVSVRLPREIVKVPASGQVSARAVRSTATASAQIVDDAGNAVDDGTDGRQPEFLHRFLQDQPAARLVELGRASGRDGACRYVQIAGAPG